MSAHKTRSQGQAAFELTIANRSSPNTNKATSSPFPLVLDLSAEPTVLEVKKAIQSRLRRLPPSRQRLTTEEKRPLLDESKTLREENVKTGDLLYLKDLGPQVAWRTVFLTEYAGPLLIQPILYQYAPSIWRKQYEYSQMQKVAFGLVIAHFAKRELETLFVHRFSASTMPLFNIFRNSAHYWLLSGLFLGVATFSPYFSAEAVKGTIQEDPRFLGACVAVWTLAELANFSAHMTLRNLRPSGTRERGIPRGGLFEYVSCANYTYEIVAWLSYTVMTLSPASVLFTVVSATYIVPWATTRHRNYRKEFKDYPRQRKALVPFVY